MTASRDKVGCVLDEAAVSDVRGVPAEFDEEASVDRAGVAEQFHLAEVVGGREDCTVGAPVARVDIRTVSCRREYTLNRPAQSAGPRRPSLVLKATGATRILLACVSVEKED